MGEKVKFDKCCIRRCKYLPESIKIFGLEFCFQHQRIIDKWLYDRGYVKTTADLPMKDQNTPTSTITTRCETCNKVHEVVVSNLTDGSNLLG